MNSPAQRIGSVSLTLLFLFFSACGGSGGFGPGANDFSYALAGKYQLWRTSAHQVMIAPTYTSETPIIPAKVIEVAWDSRFILAKRQELKRRSQSPNDTYMEPLDGQFDYWIIDVSGPTLYGPFDESAFRAKRREIAVPDSLHLKDVYAFK
jgi:hypothetical protein